MLEKAAHSHSTDSGPTQVAVVPAEEAETQHETQWGTANTMTCWALPRDVSIPEGTGEAA